jgi:hypothetical protein
MQQKIQAAQSNRDSSHQQTKQLKEIHHSLVSSAKERSMPFPPL